MAVCVQRVISCNHCGYHYYVTMAIFSEMVTMGHTRHMMSALQTNKPLPLLKNINLPAKQNPRCDNDLQLSPVFLTHTNPSQDVFSGVKVIKATKRVPIGLVVSRVSLLITGCHLCVGSSPTSGSAEDLSQYDPGCRTGHKTPKFIFD